MNRISLATLFLAAGLAATALATLTQCSAEGGESTDRGGAAPAAAGSSGAVGAQAAAGDPAAVRGGAGGSDEGSPAGNAGSDAAAAPGPVIGERIRMLVSGAMDGRLEPCGCASGQLGGLARRIAYAQEMRSYDLLVEGGHLVGGATPLDVAKAETALQVLFMMPQVTANLRQVPADSSLVGPYHALGIAPEDLRLPLDRYYGGLPSAFDMPLLAADLRSTEGGWPARAFVEHDVRGTTVRIASLTTALPEPVQDATPLPLELLTPEDGWRRALEGAADDTMRVLMIHAGPDRVRELAAALEPRPDLVLGITDEFIEPPGSFETHGGVPVVFPGIRGRILVDLTLARTSDGSTLTSYDLVPLRGSETKPGAGQDPDVVAALMAHRTQVDEDDLLAKMARQLPVPNGQSYVGSEECAKCHARAYASWKRSQHSKAWDTLEQAETGKYGWPVTEYPDCASCHVVGFREQTGFVTYEDTPHLASVGCERCHGAGSAHVENPVQNKMGRVGGGTPSRVCVECHDFEQSPDFDYMKRWAAIEHGK